MTVKCPRCGNHTAQGTDYAGFLELAEAGQLKFFCAYCGLPWQPLADEQKKVAENLRNHIAAQSV